MGKTRDLFKKIRNINETFHAKIGTIKDRNSKDLREAEEIKKCKNTEKNTLYNKSLNDPDNHNTMVTHLESDTLECEGKWSLEALL